jgi:hypothetical protein
MTCESSPPKGSRQTELPLTLSAAAFPAKISASLEKALASMAKEAPYGASTLGLLANYDLASSSWKTWPPYLIEDSYGYSVNLPRSGTMRSGIVFRLPLLARPTEGTGYGLLPTPRASDADKGLRGDLIQALRGNRNKHFKLLPTPRRCSGLRSSGSNRTDLYRATGGKIGPNTLRRFVEWMMGYEAGWTDLPPSETP